MFYSRLQRAGIFILLFLLADTGWSGIPLSIPPRPAREPVTEGMEEMDKDGNLMDDELDKVLDEAAQLRSGRGARAANRFEPGTDG